MVRFAFSKRGFAVAFKLLALLLVMPFVGVFLCVLIYRFVPVTDTVYMRQMAEKNNAEVRQQWVPLSQISTNLPLAVVSSEDNLFTKHNGFSWTAIERAYNESKKGKRVRGGSTISQQTAKNVFLANSHSFVRKICEVPITLMIELVWGKQRIMEVYLNVVELGPGLYGAEAASRKYFKHPAKSLTPAEAALMAAVLPNPLKFKVSAPSPYIRRRQGQIVALMRKIQKVDYNRGDKD
ncbi:MAG: monofunctional biosynthetic peptidoglycan transglycosylase [Bacteroidales bacterium]|nr:monofunctional biosynthetic peptidoglycan transglycosylase [Bacteroidales bacterium]